MRTLLFKKTKSSVIPGFGLTMGFTFLYMAVLVIVPLSMVFFHTMSMGPGTSGISFLSRGPRLPIG